MQSQPPSWTACPSPQNQAYNAHNVTSPGNSDHNYYGSPAVSPGSWNAMSPGDSSATSVYSYASPHSNADASSNGSVPPTTPCSVSSSSTREPLDLPAELGKERIEKSELDKGREKVAHAKALYLMQQNFGACSVKPTRPEVRSGSLNSSLSVRQAAIQRYEEKKKKEKELEDRDRKQKELLRPAPKLVIPWRKEKLATSTRKKKKPTAEEDYETISDYKREHHFIEERVAKKKALALMAEVGF